MDPTDQHWNNAVPPPSFILQKLMAAGQRQHPGSASHTLCDVGLHLKSFSPILKLEMIIVSPSEENIAGKLL